MSPLRSNASLREGCAYAAVGYAAHQAVGALVVTGDAVAGEHPALHTLIACGGGVDQGRVGVQGGESLAKVVPERWCDCRANGMSRP